MDPEPPDRILVWSYSNTDAYTLEYCDWYTPDSLWHLHFSVSQFINDRLDEFYADFSEWFNMAEFPDVEEQLLPSEAAVFLKGAGAPEGAGIDSIENYDCFSGLCAVIRHRLDQQSLEQIKLAAELFNWTIDFGLFCCDTKARALIRVGSIVEVGPYLLDRILSRLPDKGHQRNPAPQLPRSRFEQRFLPLAPLLTMLKETVDASDWKQNQFAIRILAWIADVYKAEVETV
ncbi:MAG TPA: hypothetical protein VMI94_01890 [Bryobacteraceae bacterium]|nr:hypothetical protein [Bryobacteraceae bacterium]